MRTFATISSSERMCRGGSSQYFRMRLLIPHSTMNGYRPNHGRREQYLWISPEDARLRSRPLTENDAQAFRSLAEFTQATGQEAQGIELDYDSFGNLHPPDPTKPPAVYHAADLDFRLKAGRQGRGCRHQATQCKRRFRGPSGRIWERTSWETRFPCMGQGDAHQATSTGDLPGERRLQVKESRGGQQSGREQQ